jgi:hypothetical protein
MEQAFMPALSQQTIGASAPEVQTPPVKNTPYLYMHSNPAFRDMFLQKYFLSPGKQKTFPTY